MVVSYVICICNYMKKYNLKMEEKKNKKRLPKGKRFEVDKNGRQTDRQNEMNEQQKNGPIYD